MTSTLYRSDSPNGKGAPLAGAPIRAAAVGRGLPRRVLMIAFHFPPGNSSGGTRTLKFCKYLPASGWENSVLTVPVDFHESTDTALLQQVPSSVRIHRARCFDAKAVFSVRGHYPGFVTVPDRYTSWLPFGVREALRAVRDDGIDALFSTSPIPTAHLIGLIVKRVTGLPWVVDFRDPWVETDCPEAYGALRQSTELQLERRVVRAADRITVTTVEFADYLGVRYGADIRDKTVVVPNGYDEEDFVTLPAASTERAPFTIVHAGLLDPNYRDPTPFLQAVRDGLDHGALPADLRIDFIGGGPFTTDGPMSRIVAQLRLAEVVRVIPWMPYGQALRVVSEASALLLLQGGDTQTMIPGKAFEYLRAGRLILAATPQGTATADLMRQFPGTFMANPSDATDLGKQLAALVQAWHAGGVIDRSKSGLERYSRHATAAQLAGVLGTLVGDRQ